MRRRRRRLGKSRLRWKGSGPVGSGNGRPGTGRMEQAEGFRHGRTRLRFPERGGPSDGGSSPAPLKRKGRFPFVRVAPGGIRTGPTLGQSRKRVCRGVSGNRGTFSESRQAGRKGLRRRETGKENAPACGKPRALPCPCWKRIRRKAPGTGKRPLGILLPLMEERCFFSVSGRWRRRKKKRVLQRFPPAGSLPWSGRGRRTGCRRIGRRAGFATPGGRPGRTLGCPAEERPGSVGAGPPGTGTRSGPGNVGIGS